jgi:hypothetical protein
MHDELPLAAASAIDVVIVDEFHWVLVGSLGIGVQYIISSAGQNSSDVSKNHLTCSLPAGPTLAHQENAILLLLLGMTTITASYSFGIRSLQAIHFIA